MNDRQPQQANTDEQPPLAMDDEQQRRAGLYQLLAALLRDAPSADVLDYAQQLDTEGERGTPLAMAFSSLALAARHSNPNALRHEYHSLFIGLGRGELVPYGSWYLTGFLMEKPLGVLRQDLARLGFERAEGVHEPEDHIGALCEVMAYLVADAVPEADQKAFFDAHLGSWAAQFFDDLASAPSAVFYRSVARIGRAFVDMESRYLALHD